MIIERVISSLALAALLLALLLLAAERKTTFSLKQEAVAHRFATWEFDREDGQQVFTWREPAASGLEQKDECTHGPCPQQWKEPAR